MSDMIAIFGLLFITSLAFPGLLTAWWLLFPQAAGRARRRVERTPWKTFGMGIAGVILAAIPIGVLLALPFGPAQFFGWLGVFLLLTFASLGASGIAAVMGARIADRSDTGLSETGAFVRGAVAFELAAAFPILGWLVVTPAWILTSFGAAIFSLLRWEPRAKPATPPIPEGTAEPQSA